MKCLLHQFTNLIECIVYCSLCLHWVNIPLFDLLHRKINIMSRALQKPTQQVSLFAYRLQRPSWSAPLSRLRKYSTDWKGSRNTDHAVNRINKGDTTDPTTEQAKSGQEAKKEGNGVKDKSKSQATTQRDPTQSKKRTEEEHPEAPKPVIGMADERGKVSVNLMFSVPFAPPLACYVPRPNLLMICSL